MKRERVFITEGFLKRIRKCGALVDAQSCLRLSTVIPEPLSLLSTWALVCEEIVDTEYSPSYHEQVAVELPRRGLTPGEIEEMRVFAWQTAGWLYYEMRLWDWTQLDEDDIRRAIDWQLEQEEITPAERDEMLAFLAKYA